MEVNQCHILGYIAEKEDYCTKLWRISVIKMYICAVWTSFGTSSRFKPPQALQQKGTANLWKERSITLHCVKANRPQRTGIMGRKELTWQALEGKRKPTVTSMIYYIQIFIDILMLRVITLNFTGF